MSKEIDQLREDLASAGWRFERPTLDTGVSWEAFKRLDGALNRGVDEKPPVLVISPYEAISQGRSFASASFEIRGDVKGGQWVNFQVYSVAIDRVLPELPACANILRAAWNAAVQKSADIEIQRQQVDLLEAAKRVVSWLDHANCANLPVCDQYGSMRQDMNALREAVRVTVRNSEQ